MDADAQIGRAERPPNVTIASRSLNNDQNLQANSLQNPVRLTLGEYG